MRTDSHPSDWDQVHLSDVADTFSGGTPNRQVDSFFGGDIPWIKSSEVNKDFINETEEYLTDLGLRSSSAKWVVPETPLVAMYGATAGQVSWLMIKATTNQAVLAVQSRDGSADSRWLYWALERNTGRMLASVQGSGQPNLSKSILDSLVLPPPPSQNRSRSPGS